MTRERELEDALQGIISTQEAAKITGYNVSHIRWLLRKEYIIGVKMGRDWLITQQSVTDYLAEMKAIGTAKHSSKKKTEGN